MCAALYAMWKRCTGMIETFGGDSMLRVESTLLSMLKYQPWHGPEDMPLQTKCNDIVTLCVGVRVSINWYKHTSWNLTANFYYFS